MAKITNKIFILQKVMVRKIFRRDVSSCYLLFFGFQMDVKILFFIAINFYCIHSNPYDINHLLKRGEKFCGDRLWRVVSIACQGNYNGPDKRVCKSWFHIIIFISACMSAFTIFILLTFKFLALFFENSSHP